MSKILITGGTGNLGKALVKVLDKNNISYTVGSRKNKSGANNVAVMDLVQNNGIKKAVADKEIIFHLATDMKKDTEATRNLLQAIQPESNVHLVYISIVGIDEVPFAYYQQKLASEEEIKRSGISYTILRATQFHEFIDDIFSKLLKYPIGLLPKKIIAQPIQIEKVAEELYQLSLKQPENKTYEIGGAEAHTFEQMAKEWMLQKRKKRLIINLPIFGALGKAFRGGKLTTGSKQKDSLTWKKWLELDNR